MKIIIILAISLMLFVGFRLFMILLNWVLVKMLKPSKDSIKYDLLMSVAFYLIYIIAFLEMASYVNSIEELSVEECYFIYTFIGISSMIWCYFSWDLKLKEKPKFGLNDRQVTSKKIIVFALVMVLSFINGYATMYKELLGETIFLEMKLLNGTMIVGIIAFDRLLNQIANYKKQVLMEKAESCSQN